MDKSKNKDIMILQLYDSSKYESIVVQDLYAVDTQTSASILCNPMGSHQDGACDCQTGWAVKCNTHTCVCVGVSAWCARRYLS